MNNKNNAPKKRKGAKVGLALCMAAALVLTGVYTFNQYKSNVKKEMAKIEEESKKELDRYESADAGDTVSENETDFTQEEYSAETETGEMADTETTDAEQNTGSDMTADGNTTTQAIPQEADTAQENETDVQETGGTGDQINFNENDKLIWPVSGAVLMNYSMDETVYFSTLDEYKYNPALIIGGAVNDQVISAGKGIVKSIDKTPQQGTTVTIDMGNGYEAIYGQLQNVQVKTGDSVEAKTVLGYLAEPTRYYSVEGCNLYFEFRKDGQPIDPIKYLE
nr:M23 family metallopeptidase [uncultured Sellimonas sp.]